MLPEGEDRNARMPAFTRSRWWIVINSPVVILTIASFIIGAGGAVITQAQRCRSNAEANILQFRKVSAEIESRRRAFVGYILAAQSMQELKASAAKLRSYYLYVEFRGRTLGELTQEEIALGPKMNVTDFPGFYLSSKFHMKELQAVKNSPGNDIVIWAMMDAQDVTGATDKDFPALQRDAQVELRWLIKSQQMVAEQGRLVPVCGCTAVARRMLFGHPTYIATVSH